MQPKTCSNGCCIYDGGWLFWPGGRSVQFCPRDGSRLNSDGSHDPGSAAWRDHAVLPHCQNMLFAAVTAVIALSRSEGESANGMCERRAEWFTSAAQRLDCSVEGLIGATPAAAVLAAKAALEVMPDG